MVSRPVVARVLAGLLPVVAPVVLLAVAPVAAAEEVAPPVETASIGGRVWFDRDGDGGPDRGEPGLHRTGAVELRDATGALVERYATDPTGTFRADDLAPGSYRLSQVQRDHAATTPAEVEVTLAAGGRTVVDFGIRGGRVSAALWQDADGDGTRDAGEPALDGGTVRLDGPGELVWEAAADRSGTVRFEDLPFGAGYRLGAPDRGAEGWRWTDGPDSGVDPRTGLSAALVLTADDREHHVPIGYARVPVPSSVTTTPPPSSSVPPSTTAPTTTRWGGVGPAVDLSAPPSPPGRPPALAFGLGPPARFALLGGVLLLAAGSLVLALVVHRRTLGR
ncbi:MAG TPA: SdrD B-like domain-containing protein [Pseudonocardiaceae bacterium]